MVISFRCQCALQQRRGISTGVVSVQEWADANDLKAPTLAWLDGHNSEVARLVTALCQAEQWTERPSDAHFVASSAPEMVRIVTAAMESLTGLDVPVHGAVMRSEVQLLGRVIGQYARCVAAGCDEPALLIRPPPPLTRYKQKLAEKAMEGKDVSKCASHHTHDTLTVGTSPSTH